jgi:hypothetical protein
MCCGSRDILLVVCGRERQSEHLLEQKYYSLEEMSRGHQAGVCQSFGLEVERLDW